MRGHHGVSMAAQTPTRFLPAGEGRGRPGGNTPRWAHLLLLLPTEEPGLEQQGMPLGPQSLLRTPERPTQGAGVARRWSQAQVGSGPGHQALTD